MSAISRPTSPQFPEPSRDNTGFAGRPPLCSVSEFRNHFAVWEDFLSAHIAALETTVDLEDPLLSSYEESWAVTTDGVLVCTFVRPVLGVV